MKLFLYAILALIVIYFVVGHFTHKDPEAHLAIEDKMSNDLIRRFGKYTQEKYGLCLCGLGGGADPGKIYLLNLAFQATQQPISKDDARKLILTIHDELLAEINHDVELKPYLKFYPFTSENVDIKVYFRNKDRSDVFYPYIRAASIAKGKLIFATKDPEEKYGYKTWDEETYKEAVAIVNEQERSSSSQLR